MCITALVKGQHSSAQEKHPKIFHFSLRRILVQNTGIYRSKASFPKFVSNHHFKFQRNPSISKYFTNFFSESDESVNLLGADFPVKS